MANQTRTNKWVNSWMTYLVSHPIFIIFASLLISSAFLYNAPKFEITSSTRVYLGEDNPRIKSLVQLEAEYIEDLNIFLMLVPDDGTVFNQDVLEAVHYLTEAAWEVPFVRRVDSLTNFQHTEADGDDLLVENLVVDPSSLTNADLIKIEKIALTESRLQNFLVASDGRATAVNMSLSIDTNDVHSIRKACDQVRLLKQQLAEKYPHIQLFETGYVYMLDSYNLAATQDIKSVFSLSVLIMFIGLMYFLRNVRASLTVLLIGLLPMLMGLGLVGFMGKGFNSGTILCTLMVLVLGLADGIHITKTVRRLLAEGHSLPDAIKGSVSTNFIPIVLTSVTTAIGFLTFNFTGYDGIGLMGNYVAFGVMTAFVLSISLLPALLCFCGLKPEVKKAEVPLYSRVVDAVVRYRKWLFLLALPSAISIYFVTTIEFDERTTRYLREDQAFTISLNAVQENLTGASTMLYNFNSGSEGGVSDPGFMRKVDAFAQWLRQQPEVRHVSTYTDTMKTLNQNLHGGDSAYYQLPEEQQLAAQYLLLYEMSLPFGLDLTNQINLDKSGTRMVILTDDLTIVQVKDLIARNTAWLEEHAPTFDTFANSDAITLLFSAGVGAEAMLVSGVVALLIIGLMLLFTFRSFNAGLLCVVSVISPILVAYGLWAIFVGRVGMSGALSVCMVIGISVDFSVHFISKYVHAKRVLQLSDEESVRYAFKLVSAPILTSVLVLGGGFGMLVFSVYEYNIVMGSLTAMCILFASVYALFFVPSILLTGRFPMK